MNINMFHIPPYKDRFRYPRPRREGASPPLARLFVHPNRICNFLTLSVHSYPHPVEKLSTALWKTNWVHNHASERKKCRPSQIAQDGPRSTRPPLGHSHRGKSSQALREDRIEKLQTSPIRREKLQKQRQKV